MATASGGEVIVNQQYLRVRPSGVGGPDTYTVPAGRYAIVHLLYGFVTAGQIQLLDTSSNPIINFSIPDPLGSFVSLNADANSRYPTNLGPDIVLMSGMAIRIISGLGGDILHLSIREYANA